MTLIKPLKSAEEIRAAEKLIKELNYREVLKLNPLFGEICEELEVDRDSTHIISSFYQYLFVWCRRAWGELSDENLRMFFGSWLATTEPNLSRNKFHKYWQTMKHFFDALSTRGILSPMQVMKLTPALYD